MKKIALLLLASATLLSANVAAEENAAPAVKISKILDRELPNVPGKSMRAVLVEYGPGAALASPPFLGLHLCDRVGRRDTQHGQR